MIKPEKYSRLFRKKVWLILLLAFLGKNAFSQAISNQMHYKLSCDGQSTKLNVNLTYESLRRDSSTFFYGNPAWGGQKTIFDIIGQITSDQDDSIILTPKERKITIIHASSGLKLLHYQLDGQLIIDANRARPNELFRPVIRPGSFYNLGINLFLTPKDSTYQQITFFWDHLPKGMPYLVSIDPGALPEKGQTLTMSSVETLMVVMNADLKKKEFKGNGYSYYMITSKKDTINDMQKEMEPFYTRYFPSTRGFWQDYSPGYYFISALPLLNRVPSAVTGVNLGNGFSMKYSGRFDAKKKEMLAHEISHTWIGKALKIGGRGFATTWFSEGFNDYACVFNLVRTGMFSQAEFLDYLNTQNLKSHYTNPVNSVPADSIEKYFWTNHNYEIVSYQRGFIYAFYLDNQIRLISGGKKNIRHFLLTFFKNTRKQTGAISLDDFIKAATGFLPREQVSVDIIKYMTNGQLIDFQKVRLAKDFRLHFDNDIPVIDIADGFNILKIYNW